MGFWDIAKATGNVALKVGKATVDHLQKEQAKMQSKSDDELFNTKTPFSLKELKNRGYDKEDIKERWRDR
jgi:hypothetical protein